MMKKLLSGLLALMMLCSVAVGMNLTAEAKTSHTKAEALSWAASQMGKSLDYDGSYGAQCVDLIYYYYQYLGATVMGGNASAYVSNALPSGWKRINYTSGITFQPGDIAVWNPAGTNNGGLGHIGIIESADSVGFNCYEQNWNYVQKVTKNWHYNSVLSCVIRPDFTVVNNPQGWYDDATGKQGAVYVKGWAFDKDQPTTAIQVHVYIGGEAGKGEGHALTANQKREDVGKAYSGVGNYHGFEQTISTNKIGTQEVWIYAINVGSGSNVCLGHKTVKITCAHTFNEGYISVQPTATTPGKRVRTCTKCGATRTTAIPALRNGWYTEGGKTYYYKDGKPLTYTQYIDGKRYYFNSNGVMYTGGWLTAGSNKLYFGKDGVALTYTQYIDGKRYYFNSQGIMYKGGWLTAGSKRFYFGKDGVALIYTQYIDGKRYYFNSQGVMYKGGWLTAGSKRFYFGKDGVALIYTQYINGKRYYFNGKGEMVKGWLTIGSNKFYFTESGAAATGWLKLSGNWYYFNSDGAMRTANLTQNGKTYRFNSNGVCKNK